MMHSDRPIVDSTEDILGRDTFAKHLADVITEWKDTSSLVMAIYGEWGEGKTSVLNLMAKHLEMSEDIILVRFNPWYFSGQAQLIRQFFYTTSQAVGKQVARGTRKSLSRALRKYGKILSPISIGISGFGLSLKGVMSSIENAINPENKDLDNLRAKIENSLLEERKRVVVLIDDIDRLDADEIFAIFKLVKLIADFPNTTYVLAFDPKVVARALASHFPSDDEDHSGAQFLEKIVQQGLPLPPVDASKIRDVVLNGASEVLKLNDVGLKEKEGYRVVSVWDGSVEAM